MYLHLSLLSLKFKKSNQLTDTPFNNQLTTAHKFEVYLNSTLGANIRHINDEKPLIFGINVV